MYFYVRTIVTCQNIDVDSTWRYFVHVRSVCYMSSLHLNNLNSDASTYKGNFNSISTIDLILKMFSDH